MSTMDLSEETGNRSEHDEVSANEYRGEELPQDQDEDANNNRCEKVVKEYGLKHNIAFLFNDMVLYLLMLHPDDPVDALLKFLRRLPPTLPARPAAAEKH